MRNPSLQVAKRIAEVGEHNVCTSVVVAAELRYGAEKSGSARLRERVETVLSAVSILPIEPPADSIYGKLRALLERQGRLIGPNDMLIASHALAADCILVSDNEGEFRRVPDLRIENWLR